MEHVPEGVAEVATELVELLRLRTWAEYPSANLPEPGDVRVTIDGRQYDIVVLDHDVS